MRTRRDLRWLLALGATLLAHGVFPSLDARAADAPLSSGHAVPLAQRNWTTVASPPPPPPPATTHGSGHAEGGRTAPHAKDSHDRFHVTALRFWLYREFLPKSDDADALGIELNSAWGWGCLDFANIS